MPVGHRVEGAGKEACAGHIRQALARGGDLDKGVGSAGCARVGAYATVAVSNEAEDFR